MKIFFSKLKQKIRIRTWIALGVILVFLPIVLFKLLYKDQVEAAAISLEETSTQITLSIPNRYTAILQKGDTDNYLQFYDRVQSDSSPSVTHESKGPCVTEATVVYCLRDDAFRTTTIIQQTPQRVKIRVFGRLNNEAGAGYLTESVGAYDITSQEEYTFTADGVYVQNKIRVSPEDAIGLDTDSAHNGYEWLAVSADITDAAFDEGATPDIIYGDGNTETNNANQADATEFANTNTYVVLPGAGSDTYQDAMIVIPKGGWYDDATSGVHEWHWDEGITGTEDQISAQEQNYNTTALRESRWYLLLKDENDLDSEAEREALANMYRNPDTLSFTTGSARYEEGVGNQALFFDEDAANYANMGNVSAYNFADGADFTLEAWFQKIETGVSTNNTIISKQAEDNTAGWRMLYSESNVNFSFEMSDGTDVFNMSSAVNSIAEDKWYHAVIVVDRDNVSNTTMYINGVDTSPSKVGTLANVGSLSNANNACIGAVKCTVGDYDIYGGKIDEVRVWSDVRSSTEIVENMHKEIDPASAGLIGYWRLNEGTGTIAEDLSSTDADGTLAGSPYWTTGKVAATYNNAEATYSTQTTSKSTQFDIDAGSNVSTALNGAVADGATTVTVTSTTGFPASGVAYIEGDKFSFTGTTATTFTGVPASGADGVENHPTATVVSLFNQTKPQFRIAGFKGIEAPGFSTYEGSTITKGTHFEAEVKPITDAYFAQDISFYAPFTSTTVDIGSDLTASGCTLTTTFYGSGAAIVCDSDSDDYSFTATDNIDYAKGAIEFFLSPITIHTDNVERTYFNITDGTDQFRFRKTTGNTLEFLIDEGATTYTESVTSGNYSWDLGDTVHIRLEWDDAAGANDQLKIIINGVEPTHTDSTGDFTGSSVTPGTSFILGNSATNGLLECLCVLDEFYIYDYNGTGNQAGRNKIGRGGRDALTSDSTNQTLSFAPVDANGRGEYMIFGFDTKVNGVNFELATNGATAGTLNLDWEYWNGSSWSSLESISGFTDTTGNLTRSGSVYWTTPPTNWEVNRIGSKADYYYIRASLNASSGTFTTSPVENKITTDILEFQYLNTITSEDQTFVIPTQTLVSLYWGMDEGTGTTVNDGTGNRNDGTITNALWRTEDMCIFGKCLEFDGSGDFVSRGDDDDLDVTETESFSISTWFRHPDIATNPDYLIAKHNGTAGGYKIYMDAAGTLTCGIDDDSTFGPEDFVTSTAAYDDDKWHHVSCVKNASSSLTLYVDGLTVGTPDTSFTSTGTLANSDAFYLGIDGDGSSNGWDGFIDELKYYPVARSTDQVKSDYIKGSSADRGSSAVLGLPDTAFLNQGLIGYWKLDESSGTNAPDSSGNSYDVTLNANFNFDANSGWNKGKYGNGLQFDGTNDVAQEANTAFGLVGSGDFTVSTWVNLDTISAGTNHRILTYQQGSGGTNGYHLAVVASGNGTCGSRFLFEVEKSDTKYTSGCSSSNAAALTGAWYHLTAVFRGATNTASLFVNGAEQVTGSAVNLGLGVADTLTLASQSTAGTNLMDGTLDETRIYKRALSSQEAASLSSWAPGPVGHWKLDENSGTDTVKDSSGNSYTGTLTNIDANDWTPGKYGSAITFDGSNETVSVGDNLDFERNKSFTLSTWFKTTTNGNQSLITKQDSSAPNSGYNLQLSSGGLIHFQLVNAYLTDYIEVVSAADLNYEDGNWHHVAATYDGSVAASGVKLYFDGVQVSDTDNANSLTGSTVNAIPLYLASRNAAAQHFNGTLDDARIYNYARTSGQIVEDMNAAHPLGGSPIGSQIVYWKFDEGGTTTTYNGISGGTNGTLLNMASPATSTSGWTQSGKINRALVFDGTDDAVGENTAGDIDLTNGDRFTLAAWVYVTTMPSSTEKDMIIGKWDETGTLRSMRLYLTNDDADTTGHLVAEAYDESADANLVATGTSDTIATDTWYHVVMTHNGCTASCAAGSVKIYINARANYTHSATGSFAGIETDTGTDFKVGDYDGSDVVAGNTAFTGKIDEVQIFEDELTEDQIKIVMNANASVDMGATTHEDVQNLAGGQGNGPVTWLDFNSEPWTVDCNTNSINDLSGNDVSGESCPITTGPTGGGVGYYGKGAKLDGTDDGIDLDNPAVLQMTGSMTLEAWVKATTTPDTSNEWDIISKNGAAPQVGYRLYKNDTTNTFGIQVASDGSTAVTRQANFSPAANTWYHVVGVYDATAQELHVYVNGVQKDGTLSGTVPASQFNSNQNVNIGRRPSGTTAWFPGIIDEVKIYNYARSDAQIAYDFNRGKALAWWKMDECTGTTIYDAGSEGSIGTLTLGASGTTSAGSCTTTGAWKNGVSGKFNSSMDFDGTDDYIDMNDGQFLDATDSADLTISGWFNRDTETTDDVVIAKRNSLDTATDVGYVVYLDSSNDKLNFEISDAENDEYKLVSTTAFTSAGWNHFVIVWDDDSAANTEIYINGKSNNATDTGTIGNIGAAANDVDFRIGSESDGGSYMDGKIDEVQFFRYALSPAQVRLLFNEGSHTRFGP